MTSKLKFFKEAVKNYKTSGTVMPSSRFLANKMLKEIDFSKIDVLVELGPGNGAITKYILNKLPPKAILICFEINDNFYDQLLALKNDQLIVIKASAEDILLEISKLNISKIDHIISSLPLTIIPKEVSTTILNNSYTSLKTNGTFIQYQYSLSYFKQLKTVFKDNISLDFEALNIPPAFIYRCKKLA
ncbi:phospholipid N-methyltransferase [Lutibacter sp. Hel_I_33_5]|uniref:class I SAM-dependent methyltransferase n=1 Tax=Lutibacter sp. Hel_I_33_5 TaxID=1566289 RepID=UPI0011A2770B|nr:ribosomal RNA adenine dimethylase [Lutibacter sp. Hel_I_33_5]TVZ55964.1 phospholipid N-methyltransferase [Lutibacter sp. Hel_I_33_5]